jgi:hypothetical protein
MVIFFLAACTDAVDGDAARLGGHLPRQAHESHGPLGHRGRH